VNDDRQQAAGSRNSQYKYKDGKTGRVGKKEIILKSELFLPVS